MTQTITTIAQLCELPELAVVTDANGDRLQMHCDGKPTTNPNWIYWESAGVKYHSDQIALPAVAVAA